MDVLQVPFTSAALLLAIAGIQKWRDPRPLSRALQVAHLPHGDSTVRVLATIEVAAAGAATTVDHPSAALVVAALYLAFAAFVVGALARGLPIESCGCFGRADARPSPGHVVLDACAATIAVLVAVDDVEPVRALLDRDVAQGLAVLALSAVLAAAATIWLRGTVRWFGNRATRSYRPLR